MATQTTLRGIPFTASEVRALQSGAKRQFRLPVRPQPTWEKSVHPREDGYWMFWSRRKTWGSTDWREFAPYKVGERLFVKERFWLTNHGNTFRGTGITYKDGYHRTINYVPKNRGKLCCWRPSTQMPQWAARYRIEITAVRAQRIQEISEEDAYAEGFNDDGHPYISPFGGRAVVNNFAAAWDSRHKPGERFADNILVWVHEFEVRTNSYD